MSDHYFHKIQHYARERKILTGTFHPNGSSAITEGDDHWRGFSVAYTSTGLYTITFSDAYSGLEYFGSSLSIAAATGAIILVNGAYDGTAKTKIVKSLDEDNTSGVSALADIAAAAESYIQFLAVFRNSDVFG